MSIWTSKPVVAALLLTGLAACQPVEGLSALSKRAMLGESQTAITVLDGAIRIVGPKGYCPDAETLHTVDDSAVVLLGRCFADTAAPPALVSVTVGRAGTGQIPDGAELAGFFTSDAGRATLSRRGKASDVSILSALSSDGVFLMHVQDGRTQPYWRAMTAMGGRMVSVRANGPDLATADARSLVEATVKALRRANSRS